MSVLSLRVNGYNYEISTDSDYVSIVRWNENEDFSKEIGITGLSECANTKVAFKCLVDCLNQMKSDSEIEGIFHDFSDYYVE